MVRKAFEAQAEDQARDARQRAERFLPADSVDNAVVLGRAVPTLLEEAAHAGLLVLGHRGRGALASALGSVSMALAERAPCPVVVVRGAVDGGTQPTRPIAVGVDGAEGSSTAVAFAAETAERWGVPLRVVSAWAMVPQLGWDYGTWQAISVSEWRELAGALEESARAAADAAAEQVRSKRPDLPLEAETPELQPTLALEEVSRTSSLLVVGSSGSGALGGLLLGSVSRSLLHHSVCPVAVVKAPVVKAPVVKAPGA
jgi:nucleotide-binding universal stress UspA family protein